MHVQLLLAEAIGNAPSLELDDLGAQHLGVKRFERSKSETAMTT